MTYWGELTKTKVKKKRDGPAKSKRRARLYSLIYRTWGKGVGDEARVAPVQGRNAIVPDKA